MLALVGQPPLESCPLQTTIWIFIWHEATHPRSSLLTRAHSTGLAWITNLSGQRLLSEHFHPDATACVPEGPDSFMVGHPLRVKPVNLEDEPHDTSGHVQGEGGSSHSRGH